MKILTLVCGYCGFEWQALYITRECPDCTKINKVAVKTEEDKDD